MDNFFFVLAALCNISRGERNFTMFTSTRARRLDFFNGATSFPKLQLQTSSRASNERPRASTYLAGWLYAIDIVECMRCCGAIRHARSLELATAVLKEGKTQTAVWLNEACLAHREHSSGRLKLSNCAVCCTVRRMRA